MPAIRYFDLIREMRDAYDLRLRLVASVRERGIKLTARLFVTSDLTVRKWWRRYHVTRPIVMECLTQSDFAALLLIVGLSRFRSLDRFRPIF